MKRILIAGAVACALSMAFIAPVIADKESEAQAEPVSQESKAPKPGDLKIQDGKLEGHKKPMEVYLKALKAAKGGDMEAFKACFSPDTRTYLDNPSYDGDGQERTVAQSLVSILKGFSEEGQVREQGTAGNYAVIAVKNGEAVNLIKTAREGQWTDEGKMSDRNWYLASTYAGEYRTDYNAPGVKSVRDAIEKGDLAKLKEHLDEWQTKVLDLISGAEDGVDGYALLMKSLQKLSSTKVKPIFLLNRYDTSLAYWFHDEEAEDTFLVLRFMGDMYDWETEKKYTKVQVDINTTSDFKKDAADAFKNFVSDWSWD